MKKLLISLILMSFITFGVYAQDHRRDGTYERQRQYQNQYPRKRTNVTVTFSHGDQQRRQDEYRRQEQIRREQEYRRQQEWRRNHRYHRYHKYHTDYNY